MRARASVRDAGVALKLAVSAGVSLMIAAVRIAPASASDEPAFSSIAASDVTESAMAIGMDSELGLGVVIASVDEGTARMLTAFTSRAGLQGVIHELRSSPRLVLDPTAHVRCETSAAPRRQRMIRRDTTGRKIESRREAMREIQSETFASLLSAEDEIRAQEQLFPDVISVPAWNAIQDRWNRAAQEVIGDPALLAALRHIVPDVREPRDRRMLAQLLLVPLDELPSEQSAILADPRVGLTAEQVEIAPAIYMVDVEPDPREVSPYDSDEVDPEEPCHDLTRMGGLPTVGPWERPDTPFILQLDLSTLSQDDAIRAFVSRTPLPQEGLLQLFHTTMGDSRSDPQRAGGGSTVLYVPEQTLSQRSRPHGDEAYPARRIRMRMLPAFRFGPAKYSNEASRKVIALQMRADAIARAGTRLDEEGYAARTDPFEEIVPSSSRMLGIQWFDVDDSDETREVLARDLPLGTPDDRHILLLDVSSDTVLEGIFGDDGRLEIWIRASDLVARDFSHVVSFIRSS